MTIPIPYLNVGGPYFNADGSPNAAGLQLLRYFNMLVERTGANVSDGVSRASVTATGGATDTLDDWMAALEADVAALAAHLADTADAHDASAISYVGGTAMSATDVEAAIDELATEKLDASSYTAADVLAKLLTVVTLGTISTMDEMTAAQYWANTADKAVTTDTAWSAADPVTITFSTTLTLDFNAFINGVCTLTNNTTLQTPSNRKKGQSGCIELIQDGTGSRTLDSTNTAFVWAGGTNGVLSTAIGARDLLFYQILDDDKVFLTLVKAVA